MVALSSQGTLCDATIPTLLEFDSYVLSGLCMEGFNRAFIYILVGI